jgi:hypothetical protein
MQNTIPHANPIHSYERPSINQLDSVIAKWDQRRALKLNTTGSVSISTARQINTVDPKMDVDDNSTYG